jgi:hypothetical protein
MEEWWPFTCTTLSLTRFWLAFLVCGRHFVCIKSNLPHCPTLFRALAVVIIYVIIGFRTFNMTIYGLWVSNTIANIAKVMEFEAVGH